MLYVGIESGDDEVLRRIDKGATSADMIAGCLTPAEALAECRWLLAAMDADGIEFRSNHASNWLALKGRLARDKPRLPAELDAALRDPRLMRPDFLRAL